MNRLKELCTDIKENFTLYEAGDINPYLESLDDILRFITPDCIYYRVKDKYYWIKNEPRRAYQRATKGHTSDDWWNINSFVHSNCLPMLKTLREKHFGHPMGLTEKKWDKILDTIIEGWELEKLDMEDHADLLKGTKKQRDRYWKIVTKRYEKIEKANELFGKYLGNLWD